MTNEAAYFLVIDGPARADNPHALPAKAVLLALGAEGAFSLASRALTSPGVASAGTREQPIAWTGDAAA